MQVIIKISLAIFLCGSFSGCRNEPIPVQLTGNWLWQGSSGGIAGMIIKPGPGERVILRFSSDGQFILSQNDTLTYSGEFRLTTERSIYSGKDESKIELKQTSNINPVKNARPVVLSGIITSLSASQLSIGDNYFDGFGSSFVRN